MAHTAGLVESSGAHDANSTKSRRAAGRAGTSGGAPVDQRDINRLAHQPPCGGQATEPSTTITTRWRESPLEFTKDHLSCPLCRRPSYDATSFAEHNEMLASTARITYIG
jgi:hypothetical protein